MGESRNRILLVEPPFYRLFKDTYSLDRYPLSLGYLAGTVKKETRWAVTVYNADFCRTCDPIRLSFLAGDGYENYLAAHRDRTLPVWREVRDVLESFRPDVVGITAKSQNFASACVVARLAKELCERTTVVVGGPHPSMVGLDVLKCRDIDVVVRGEGERTIVELLNAITEHRPFDEIHGIAYRENGHLRETPERELESDLDSLCFPHEGASEILHDHKDYRSHAFGNIFTIRGCPYNCFYCGSREIWGRKPRYRSVENVIEEVQRLRELGVQHVDFRDDTFGVRRDRIHDLCNGIATHCPGLSWGCEMHVKLVEEETVSLMKAAGCSAVSVGFESGNNEILRAMRKNVTVEEALAACAMIKRHGIVLRVFFLVGFPQETEETLNDTITAIRQVQAHSVIYSVFTPYPGTEAFEYCKAHGLIGEDYDVSLYNHQSPANCFCHNIARDRFRELVGDLEREVDRRNRATQIRNLASFSLFTKIRERGVAASARRGLRILLGR